eukprot:2794481-Amphidinium_carterae.1
MAGANLGHRQTVNLLARVKSWLHDERRDFERTWERIYNLQKRAYDIRGTAYNVLGYSLPESPRRDEMEALETWLDAQRIEKETEAKHKRLSEWKERMATTTAACRYLTAKPFEPLHGLEVEDEVYDSHDGMEWVLTNYWQDIASYGGRPADMDEQRVMDDQHIHGTMARLADMPWWTELTTQDRPEQNGTWG